MTGHTGAASAEGIAPVLVIQNSESSSLGRATEWLKDSGCDPVIIRAYAGEPLPDSLESWSGLIMLGGAPLPSDDDAAPWFPRERELARQAVDIELPILGVCLGGQMLAYACGGEVTRRAHPAEHGMTDIFRVGTLSNDALFSQVASKFPMIENHVDSITKLPHTAVLLARSERVPVQAFRVGSCAWGLQFHPEVDAGAVEHWDSHAIEQDGFEFSEVVRQAAANASENEMNSRELICAFGRIASGWSREVS